MKKIFIPAFSDRTFFYWVISALVLFYPCVFGPAPAFSSDTSRTFNEQFNALVPPESSSVHSDYLFEQIALGSQFTVMALDHLSQNGNALNEKAGILIEKFDILIEQNKKIIELLGKRANP